ncbi:MAG: hypothetical protein QHJ34_01645 [bacterium]|jgi:hypothetical protein|nr:hypothetical protein [candidate division KSB1 bacterium]MDH7558922.1 hypothetical protein [bacterium]
MSKGLAVVLGMTIAYGASLVGMVFAYLYYRKYRGRQQGEANNG